MGFYQENVKGNRTVVSITANDPEGPYTAVMFINGGETISGKRGTFKTLKGAKKAASKWIDQHGAYPPIRRNYEQYHRYSHACAINRP